MRALLPELVGRRFGATLKRFPTVGLASAAACVASFIVIGDSSAETAGRVWATAVLALPFLTAAHLLAERLEPPFRVAAPLVAVGLMALLFLAVRGWQDESMPLRLVQWGLASHAMVAVAWFAGLPEGMAFWRFNQLMLQRLLIASFFAAVLAIGLAIALSAVDRLLGAEIPNNTYPRLFALIAFGIHPWVLLAGVPADRTALEQDEEVPLGLKVFAQHVLIPLVVVYLTILTIYLGRVIVTRAWPSGWIGYLVSSVSVVGTFALLLVHPLRTRPDGRWVDTFSRWFFVAMLPALIMLLMAVGQRIKQYGVTEPRYALAGLAGWLLGVCAFYLITRSRAIRPIPLSLGAVALIGSVGPWRASAVARRSQVARFEKIVATGVVGPDDIGREHRVELRAVARHLREWYGAPGLAIVARTPADTVARWIALGRNEVVDSVLARRGIDWRLPLDDGRQVVVDPGPDTAAIRGTDLPDGSTYYAPRHFHGSFNIAHGRDTLRFVTRLPQGTVTVDAATGAATLGVGEVIAALPKDGQRAVPLRRPLAVSATLPDGRRVDLLITNATWHLTDTLVRSLYGAILVSDPGRVSGDRPRPRRRDRSGE